jgi:hypothetical protein
MMMMKCGDGKCPGFTAGDAEMMEINQQIECPYHFRRDIDCSRIAQSFPLFSLALAVSAAGPA